MNHPQALRRYRHADGSTHDVLVHRTPEGDWQVLDRTPSGTRVVETLSGVTDGRPQAEALARDYAATAPQAKGRNPAERIPEKRGAHGHSDRHQPNRAQHARGASLPDPAR